MWALAFLIALLCGVAAPGAAKGAVVWAVGDGANAGGDDDLVGAMIAADNPDALLYLGDVYETGTAAEFATHYESAFGSLKALTYPTPGNHEWGNRATGYFPYWQARFGGAEYYSVHIGSWHMVSLNSEAEHGVGSDQVAWLEADLATRTDDCTIAFLHRPRRSAGSHGDGAGVATLTDRLAGRAVAVLAGHDHNYQRISRDGLVHFVVGTAGRRGATAVNPAYQGLDAYDTTNQGALRLEFAEGRATYAFRTLGGGLSDSGTVQCGASAPPAPAPNPGAGDGGETGVDPDGPGDVTTGWKVRLRTPRAGDRARRRHLRKVAGTVAGPSEPIRVDVALRQRRATTRPAGASHSARGVRRCRWLRRRGMRTGLCSRPRWLRARAGVRWSLRLNRAQRGSLGEGGTSIHVRVRDGKGNRAVRRFRIRIV